MNRRVRLTKRGPAGPRVQFFSGEGAPTSIPGAVTSDIYLDTATGNLYKRGASSWTFLRNLNGPPGPGMGEGAWEPATAYTTGQVVQAPDGSLVQRNVDGTSAATFNAAERAKWTAIEGIPGTMTRDGIATLTGKPIDTTMDDTAFAAFLDDLDDGDVVFIPPNQTLELSEGITLTKPVTFNGPGTLKDTRGAPTSAFITIPPAASGTIIACPLEGSVAGGYIEPHNGILIAGVDNGAGVAPTYVTDVVIDTPRITGFGQFAVRATFAQGGSVDIGEASYCGGGGFFSDSPQNLPVSIKHMHHMGPSDSQTYGVQFSRHDDSSDLVQHPRAFNCSGHVEVADNCPDMHLLGTHGGEKLHLSFGTAIGIKLPIDLAASQGDDGAQLYACKDVTFFGGTADSGVTDGSSDRALSIAGANKTISGVLTPIDYATGISGHIDEIIGYGHQSDIGSGAVLCRDTKGLNLSLGVVRAPSPTAVCMYHDNQDFHLAIGTVEDAWSNTLSHASWVGIIKNTNKGLISRLAGTRGSKTATNVNTHGVRVDAAAHANTRIRLGSAVDLTNATTKVSGNITGVIPWATGQVGIVIDGTLTALHYSTGLIMSSGKKIIAAASTETGAGLQIPAGVPPTSPIDGEVWTDAATGRTHIAVGGTTRRMFTGLEQTAPLTFGLIPAGQTVEQTVSVPGAAVGDRVHPGRPATGVGVGLRAEAWVSAPDTVTISLYNSTGSGVTPTAGTSWKVAVVKS